MNDPDPKVTRAVQKLETILSPYPRDVQIEVVKRAAGMTALKPVQPEATKKVAQTDMPDFAVSVSRSDGQRQSSNLDAVKSDIERAMAPLAPDSRQRVLDRIQKDYAGEIQRLQHEVRAQEESRELTERKMAAVMALREWVPDSRLERNDCSRLHKLKEAAARGYLVSGEADRYMPNATEIGAVLGIRNTFVVKHSWAEAFEGAEGISNDVRIPYDTCAFEFRICGRSVILAVIQHDDGKLYASAYLEAGEFWYITPDEVRNEGLVQYLLSQVSAISIALDAEVATDSVIRAPHKLNEKRAKQGKPPLQDYHIVDLARRHRVANPTATPGAGSKKRLHFRRGHWRHFDNSKTWIRWCLVGNPDLGFIQKHYAL